MKINGKKSFTISQLSKLEFLLIQSALYDYYQLEMNSSTEGITARGAAAANILSQINDFLEV